MKKLFEKIIEGVLACSGFVTSITIVLIILFLFSEALGLFNSRVIEEGYVLALNKDNKVSELTPAQIKDVFDEEITNWNEVGGQDMPIRLFRLEDITQYYTEEELGAAYEHAGVKITELVERTPGIIAYGALFPGDEDLMHQKNECMELSRFRLMTKIYAEAIYKLSAGGYNN